MPKSLIEETLAEITQNHTLDPITDYCKVENEDCRLKSGHEVTFISLIANILFEMLRDQLGGEISYNNWVYMPSRRAEEKVGYDLSIGRYDAQRRIRTMNKLLLNWCDKRRSWRLTVGSKDHNHFKSLFVDWSKSQDSKNNINSYLVLNVCHCIHEYRRIGIQPDGYPFHIPGIESLLRTCIVPLKPIFEFLIENEINEENVNFQYKRGSNKRLPQEQPQEYLARIGSLQNHGFNMEWNNMSQQFNIIPFQAFCAEAIGLLMDQ
jgi:hypothetical protein